MPMTKVVMRGGKLLMVGGKLTTCEEACCGCSSFCSGPPRICSMTIDSPIHTVTLSWDDGDITWLTSPPGGSAMATLYASHPYNGNADWELCYIAALPGPENFETTRNTYTDSFSATACGVVQSGEFRRLQYQTFITGGGVPYLTLHRNIPSNAYSLSIYTFFDVGSPSIKPIGDLYGWDLFFNGTPVANLSQWINTDTYHAPRYSGWKSFTIASCNDIYDTFSIPANAPALFSLNLPPTLTTALSSSICSGSPSGVRFTDVGYFRSGGASTPRIGRIYKNYTTVAAPDIDITFAECPP